ncbi:ABC transporter ATP-binding protein [Clostridium beijerinckii]|uniref:ATP-binding cassette subfamily B protein n=1 Tax=Clostridium beijerinckii TaxID=1520 RepID=A0AAX0AVP0_CLOBE|nr:ABC transporter ATP-binding protein [Clostridium beijerinckii]MBA8934421.1 ATP-binding cassette subfamily B protein [Clostridium beijerinckii]NRT35691.1 ATP-binding cassette subfamily B protein [Clostridium beijerinckii]NRT44881.1 ATP-binding cassette subfamily B protein [Clostridium beijerinckii]NRT86932.1 ATP-binding cassette subfamily B protein [Clostridium beijerinckii]NRU38608.1 ATP-binding cassette subfamily B protein [Clostridium beijerinckii]
MKEKSWISIILSLAKEHKHLMILSVACGIASVAAGMVPYFGVANIIVMFFNDTKTFENILFWSAICLLGYFMKIFLFTISTLLSHNSAFHILKNMRRKVSTKLMYAPLGSVMGETVGKLKNVMVDEIEKMETPLAHMIPEFTSNMLIPIGIFIYITYIDWRMALAALITIPLGMMPYLMVMKSYKKKYDKYMEANNYMNSTIVEYIEGIEVIKAFNQSTSSYEKYKNAVISFRDYTLDWFKSTWKYTSSAAAILPSTLLGVLPIGLYLYMEKEITASSFAICIILSLGIIEPILKLSDFINEMQIINYAVQATNDLLELKELESTTKEVTFKNYDVEMKNVSFSYDESKENNVLDNVSITLPQGKFTALVGPSGGGKSTVARLIARFWDVKAGEITIGGINLCDIPLEQLMDIVSFVTQDNFLFNYSILENIRLGNPSASDEEVFEAAKLACCDEFISKLDYGYKTNVGDAGGKLSGGERQRIAIARAILKNAPIVILDEATAFTDPENEDKLQRSISELTRGKTLLVIAHRLSTVKDADNIVVLENGKVVMNGTHKNLLKDCALYCDMWNAHINSKKWAAGKESTRNQNLNKGVVGC